MDVIVDISNPSSDPVNGVNVTGNVVTLSNPLVIYRVIGTTNTYKLVLAGAVNVILDQVSITTSTANAPISVSSSDVLMRLVGDSRLESTGGSATLGKAGLEILQGASLTLEEDTDTPGGTLTAIGGFGSSGIGSSINSKGGNLTITSGVITAIGYTTTVAARFSGAGIGAGASTLAAGSSFGTIVIDGGIVNATGGNVASNGGAGIGSGHASVGSSVVTGIVINGGKVTAKGGDFTTNFSGAGIGSACAGANAVSRVESITIGGADTEVTATGGSASGATGSSSGSGIGSSWPTAANGESSVGDITIDAGVIIATGGTVVNFTGSGIGAAGTRFAAISSVGNILISSGTITAIGGNSITSVDSNGGSGIGSGFANGGGTSSAGSITILGGDITAAASPLRQGGAGIGAGSAQGADSTSMVQDITISNANVIATGSANGAGIGTGGVVRLATSNVLVKTGVISITNGTTVAVGLANSPGIGPGTAAANSTCTVASILISGGTVEARGSTNTFNTPGGAGIGTGYGVGGTSSVGNIEITDGAVITEASSGFSGAGIGTGGATNQGEARGIAIVDKIIIQQSHIILASSGGDPVNDSGVGIGAAYALRGAISRVNALEITDSTLDRVFGSLNSAAIGSGRADFDQSQSSVGSITISNSTFGDVVGGNFGAGIGTGNGMEGNVASMIGTFQGADLVNDWKNWSLGDITITNSTFNSIAAFPFLDTQASIIGGTGIGSGATAARSVVSTTNGISKIGNILLDGVMVSSITGGRGAPGIGAGYSTNGGESHVNSIVLRNSTIEAVKGGMFKNGDVFEFDKGPGIGTGYANDFRIAESPVQYDFGGTSTIDSIRIENTQIGGAFGGNEAPGIGASFTENKDPANAGLIENKSHIQSIHIVSNSVVTAYAGIDANGIGISEVAYSRRTPADAADRSIKGSSNVDTLEIDNTTHVVAYAINFTGIWTGLPNSVFFDASPPISGTFVDNTFNQRDQLWTGLINDDVTMTENQWLASGGIVNTGNAPANIINATFYKGRVTDGINGINRIDTSEELVVTSQGATDGVDVSIPPLYKYVAFTGEDSSYFLILNGGTYQNKKLVDRHTTLNFSSEPTALANIISETVLRLKVLQFQLFVTYFANTQSVNRAALTSGSVPVDHNVYINDNYVMVQNNPNNMVLQDFNFFGWSLNDNGTGTGEKYQYVADPPSERKTVITGNDGLGIQSDQNLYAIWNKKEPPIPPQPPTPPQPPSPPQPPPIVIIDVNPPIIPPGGETVVTITVQNIANIPIEKNLLIHLPRGFKHLPQSLIVRNRPLLMRILNGADINLGINMPGEIDIVRFRLVAPLISFLEQHMIRSILHTKLGNVTTTAHITIEEHEE
ncbi:beta strand repeat-containing protein [Paenibacillus thalictri]|uniref:Uncharacterized protein n=1 Tax=Paenibacillus thalictri TaxID=2527873 RepID=A0A4Q9E2B5_9BACL|nr:hypothetical protein [Paenibacillus thalictri]TBL81771.1 hypothetical protein EYB31_01905 [Paenibacillus thalictri]